LILAIGRSGEEGWRKCLIVRRTVGVGREGGGRGEGWREGGGEGREEREEREGREGENGYNEQRESGKVKKEGGVGT